MSMETCALAYTSLTRFLFAAAFFVISHENALATEEKAEEIDTKSKSTARNNDLRTVRPSSIFHPNSILYRLCLRAITIGVHFYPYRREVKSCRMFSLLITLDALRCAFLRQMMDREKNDFLDGNEMQRLHPSMHPSFHKSVTFGYVERYLDSSESAVKCHMRFSFILPSHQSHFFYAKLNQV